MNDHDQPLMHAQLMDQLSQHMAHWFDDSILRAVNRRLGTDFRTAADPEFLRTLQGRLTRTSFPDGREAYALDGQMIIEFFPPEFRFNSNVVNAERKFRDYTVPDTSVRSTSA